LSYASAGVGSIAHLSAELFAGMADLHFVHVPYKGTAGYLPDLIGGRVDFMFAPIANVVQPAQAGKLRALAVTSLKRAAVLPETPTMSEAGVAGYQAVSWYMLLAPAATPPAIVNVLSAATVRLLAMAEVQKRLAREGADAAGSTPAEAARFLRDEIEQWGRVIRRAGVTAE
jgi:tripartite-type tricarboxylate transporter receptor subunit TctC